MISTQHGGYESPSLHDGQFLLMGLTIEYMEMFPYNEEALLWRAAATTTLLNGTAAAARLEF
jgi:hypothetical protein